MRRAVRTRLLAAFVPILTVAAGCRSDDDEAAPASPSATVASTPLPGTTVVSEATAPPTTLVTTAGPATLVTSTTVPLASDAACAGISDDSVDLSRLPVGDEKVADAPTCDHVFTCQRFDPNAGGAQAQGPWFNGDGTWSSTAKLHVSGSVDWDERLDITFDGERRVISSNDLPEHPTGQFPISADDPVHQYDANPGSISEQSVEYSLPLSPTVADEATCVGGEIGILLTGVVLFSAFDAGGRDAKAWEAQDDCDGHPQNTGLYHYHALSSCVDDPGAGHSTRLGYAFDGFGIFGMRGEDGENVTNADLDECHGHTHPITWDGAEVEMYHYHATAEFPYVIGCYRGTPIDVRPG